MMEFEEDIRKVSCHNILDTLKTYFLTFLFLEVVINLFKNTFLLLLSSISSFSDDNNAILLAVIKTIKNNRYLIFKQILLRLTYGLDIYLNIY